MIRGLYTAASGMTAQQTNVDTISNNIANVNTVGYKKEAVNFKSLMYETLQGNSLPGETNRPEPMQVGHGVRLGSVTRSFETGNLQDTGNNTDMSILGDGFFAVSNREDEEAYTKDGSFRIAVNEDGTSSLVSSDGYPILSIDDEPIILDYSVRAKDISVGQDGLITYVEPDTGMSIEVAQLKIVQFPNVEGLEGIGNNLFKQTDASGEPLIEGEDEGLIRSEIRTGYLEGSNVNIADEMVKLIVAQRAYELNSTAIKTVDTMMQQANELKRV